jgi:hypothetical protein
VTTWGATYWPWFLTIASVFLLVPELFALVTNSFNTLSWYAWNKLDLSVSVNQGMDTVAWWGSLIVWVLFVIIITGHIWWKGI